jgi:hypothetical protein
MFRLCLPKIPFSSFHEFKIVTLRSKLPQYQFAKDREGLFVTRPCPALLVPLSGRLVPAAHKELTK